MPAIKPAKKIPVSRKKCVIRETDHLPQRVYLFDEVVYPTVGEAMTAWRARLDVAFSGLRSWLLSQTRSSSMPEELITQLDHLDSLYYLCTLAEDSRPRASLATSVPGTALQLYLHACLSQALTIAKQLADRYPTHVKEHLLTELPAYPAGITLAGTWWEKTWVPWRFKDEKKERSQWLK